MLPFIISSAIAIALVIAFCRFIDHQPIKALGFAWPGYQQDALAGFCLAPAILGIGTLVLYFHNNLQWEDITFHARDLFIGLVFMIMIAVAEEMVFRGYLLNNLLQSFNKWVALSISAALFAILHGTNPGIGVVAMINLVLGGLLLGINYIYTRNLWFAIFLHFSWNFFQGPVLGYKVSGVGLQSLLQQNLQGDVLFTGGSFGFEGSIIDTFVTLMAILLLYMAYEGWRVRKSESW